MKPGPTSSVPVWTCVVIHTGLAGVYVGDYVLWVSKSWLINGTWIFALRIAFLFKFIAEIPMKSFFPAGKKNENIVHKCKQT